jgi:hypothetical protein
VAAAKANGEAGGGATLQPGGEYVQQVRAKVLEPVDVVVAGGGTAGVIAALAAARGGAKTMLIEGRGFLGGMLTDGNAGITMFQKFSGKPEEHAKDLETLAKDPDALHVAKGIPMEITKRLLAKKYALGNEGTVGAYLFTSSENFKRVLVEMMEEAKVKLRFYSMIVDVVKDGSVVKGVVMESKSGREIVPAKMFIDCTGDGDLCVRAGAEYTVGVTKDDVCAAKAKIGEMHPMGVMFKVGNVDFDRLFDYLGEHREFFSRQPFARFTYEEAFARYKKGEMATFDLWRKGKNPARVQVYNLPDKGVACLGCPSIAKRDGCNADDVTAAECELAKIIGRWMDSLRDFPGFEKAFLLQVPQMGVRETRHIQGDYVLGLMDIYEQKKFDDCIGFGAHPIDTRPRPAWLNDPETSYPPRWHFQIPFRSLVVKGLDNTLVAGRCISATHEALASCRVMGNAMATGIGAGAAAAQAVKKGIDVRAVDASKLGLFDAPAK